ncbi:DUF5672 family protein [Draconibacterium sp. IB214405]|uniref:DUF5672 family protein n=1 Tax=Draconibacterium sp. IB214405 TaxID=3097352 RepID=UPI002A182FF3|nr:DUF5672 family protein [Draconibacterium sp. IB214405]MDX8338074.1 DUF5672 family protein [Draconibacterium sp. IB214405]
MKIVEVIIPVYKELPDKSELMSFKQCLNVLGRHPIVLVCPHKMILSEYEKIANDYNVDIRGERFDDYFFSSIEGYNRLMLSKEFYSRFKESKYILIYQLDAWVFKDELNYWCNEDHDYIGAPWFENYGSEEEGMKLTNEIGNGGFSLRKVQFCIDVLSWSYPILTPRGIIRRYRMRHNLLKTLIVFPNLFIQFLGFKNNLQYYILDSMLNEDVFWSLFKNDSWKNSSIPDAEKAIKFSIEKSPKYLSGLTGDELPFGCHAWERYAKDFWKSHMEDEY